MLLNELDILCSNIKILIYKKNLDNKYIVQLKNIILLFFSIHLHLINVKLKIKYYFGCYFTVKD